MKIILVVLFISISLYANWKTQREGLEKVYIINEFRIFYSLSGVNQLSDKSDNNHNNIPDFIENLSLQLTIADDILSNKLGFIAPLKNTIYKNRADYIDIHVLKLKKGDNGLAGDAVIKYNYKTLKSNAKSISMSISSSLPLGNLTPLHELFHIYQNGYSMIKNRWYTEGTARWSEIILLNKIPKTNLLPKSKKDLEKLFKQTYESKFFWNRVAYLCSSNKKFDTREYKNLYYLGSNKKVINGNFVHGFEYSIKLLENLDYIDDLIAKENHYMMHEWKEKEQKNNINNKYILMAIVKTLKENSELCVKNRELINFIDLSQNYINKN